jgi:heme exporter protein B
MAARSEAGFAGKVLTLARKDMWVEARGRDTLPPMLAFSVAVVLVLAFTLPDVSEVERASRAPEGTVSLANVLSGFLWITFLFAGLIGFARTFEVERQGGAIDALLLVPLDRSGLFAAKALANLAYIAIIQLVLTPVFALLFGLDLGWGWATFALVCALSDIGFVSVGTLFSSLAAHTRSRELILPLLSLPVLVPVFIAATELTSDLFLGAGLDALAARGWFAILVAFGAVFSVVGALAFEYVID